jgi:hypothetical protein
MLTIPMFLTFIIPRLYYKLFIRIYPIISPFCISIDGWFPHDHSHPKKRASGLCHQMAVSEVMGVHHLSIFHPISYFFGIFKNRHRMT